MMEGVAQTLVNGNCPGHHNCIALDGDKLKPRTDQSKGGNGFGVNEDGAGYTLTAVDRHGVAYGRKSGGFDPYEPGGVKASMVDKDVSPTVINDTNPGHHNGVVECYENHAQDSRVQSPIDTAPTQGSSNANSAGISGNNPLVVHRQISVGLDGYNQQTTGEVAPTISGAASDIHHTGGVIATNSNGGDVMPVLTASEGKGSQNEKDMGGGGMCLFDKRRINQQQSSRNLPHNS